MQWYQAFYDIPMVASRRNRQRRATQFFPKNPVSQLAQAVTEGCSLRAQTYYIFPSSLFNALSFEPNYSPIASKMPAGSSLARRLPQRHKCKYCVRATRPVMDVLITMGWPVLLVQGSCYSRKGGIQDRSRPHLYINAWTQGATRHPLLV